MKEFGGLPGLAMAHPRFVARVAVILEAQSQAEANRARSQASEARRQLRPRS